MRTLTIALLLLATPAFATTWPTCAPDAWVIGDCTWCGATGATTLRQFYQRQGYFCVPTTRRYDWRPCWTFNAQTCSVADVLAGRMARCRSALGNHATRYAEDAQSARIAKIERRLFTCLGGHGL